ncbi:hypothetical protein AB241_16490 [Salmonella enterica]|nr:hypothetical protein [Salmonella enterica]ECL8012582.1 hypothetical protein [Salmonella enterica subsp. enterica]EDR6194312.1 hypothetical protein [Salmonella enterica subsp. enterica serovar Aqua]EAM8407046.1 hypothetical protein [Salmonella enterica]EAX1487341.1 hypothetical protein [Salmonella enterica]
MSPYYRYVKIVLSVILFSCAYGILIPSLISMKDNASVALGIILAFTVPPCIYAILKSPKKKDI